jgi:hypothetical protein
VQTDASTPEQAALQGYPMGASCRVVASRVLGDTAYVLLDTHAEGWPYLYGINCYRQNGRWHESTSGNGGGWSLMRDEEDLGTLAFWDRAPPGAEALRVEFHGEVREEEIHNGVYLLTWFDVPSPEGTWPQVRAFRIGGIWRPAIHTMLGWSV